MGSKCRHIKLTLHSVTAQPCRCLVVQSLPWPHEHDGPALLVLAWVDHLLACHSLMLDVRPPDEVRLVLHAPA